MKFVVPILFGLFHCFCTLSAQDFSKVDALARSIQKSDYPNPEALAQTLCKDLPAAEDKARAIFTWLTANIRYDVKAPPEGTHLVNSVQEYENQLALQAYKKGKGVCMHFAHLYKKMADAVGLTCVYIRGNSKGSLRGGWSGHAWNAVQIQGQWKLLDATWGAGYIDEDRKFKQAFLPGYFFTPARVFALDHFPDDVKWQLLDTPIEKTAFKHQCTISYGDESDGISDAIPINEPLSKGPDGRFLLQLKIRNPPPVIQLIMGNREIPYKRVDKDGWLILQFRSGKGQELEVWGGAKNQQVTRTTLMGIFPVK